MQYHVPVSDLLGPSFANSLKLAAVAFVIVVPLSILGGTIAGLRRGSVTDRVITITGLSFTAIPEFVTAIVFILIFGLWLGWLPVIGDGAGGLERRDADQVPAPAELRPRRRAVRLHRAHHACRA